MPPCCQMRPSSGGPTCSNGDTSLVYTLYILLHRHSDPPQPPPTPAQLFIRDYSRPFLAGVSVQPYPDAVLSVTATLNKDNVSATVTAVPPAYHGASSITSYTVTALEVGEQPELVTGVPGQVVNAGAGADTVSATMTGLKSGKTYSFQVTPKNDSTDDKNSYAKYAVGSSPVEVP